MVFSSPTKSFKYFDEAKIQQYCPDFVRPTKRYEMSFQEFSEKLENWKHGEERLESNITFSCTYNKFNK